MLKKILIGIAVFFVGIVVITLLFGEEVNPEDYQILEDYQPTPEIAEVTEKIQFTDKGKALFYRADPEFVDADTFREVCLGRAGIELAAACIKGKSKGNKVVEAKINLLELDDPQFADQRFTSAAHETLHMAYQSMTGAEKAEVGKLIKQELEKLEDDPHLTGIISILEKAEGADNEESLINEVHSILGTEYSDLSEELEDYYSQYFVDRQQTVAIYQDSAFSQSRARLEALSHQAEQMQGQLAALRSKLSGLEAAGDTSGYNQTVGEYNRIVNQYNALARESQSIHQDIVDYYQFINPSYQVPETVN